MYISHSFYTKQNFNLFLEDIKTKTSLLKSKIKNIYTRNRTTNTANSHHSKKCSCYKIKKKNLPKEISMGSTKEIYDSVEEGDLLFYSSFAYTEDYIDTTIRFLFRLLCPSPHGLICEHNNITHAALISKKTQQIDEEGNVSYLIYVVEATVDVNDGGDVREDLINSDKLILDPGSKSRYTILRCPDHLKERMGSLVENTTKIAPSRRKIEVKNKRSISSISKKSLSKKDSSKHHYSIPKALSGLVRRSNFKSQAKQQALFDYGIHHFEPDLFLDNNGRARDFYCSNLVASMLRLSDIQYLFSESSVPKEVAEALSELADKKEDFEKECFPSEELRRKAMAKIVLSWSKRHCKVLGDYLDEHLEIRLDSRNVTTKTLMRFAIEKQFTPVCSIVPEKKS